tara:strand:- start:84 stop:323 length:240 start_codon:yes stop_codon:yes gene_type:complete
MNDGIDENTIRATAISDFDCKQYSINLDEEYEHVKSIERKSTTIIVVHYNSWHAEPEQLLFSNATEVDLFCELFDELKV